MAKPTQHELEAALTVMQYVLDSTIKYESYAIHTIAHLETALEEFPRSEDEIQEITSG